MPYQSCLRVHVLKHSQMPAQVQRQQVIGRLKNRGLAEVCILTLIAFADELFAFSGEPLIASFRTRTGLV
jgi:hypothetical protein